MRLSIKWRHILLCLLLCICCICQGQSTYQYGLLPSINLHKKYSNDIKFNLKIESRQELKAGSFNTANELQHNFVLTDFTLIGAKKIGFNKTVAVGYLHRFRDGDVIQRTIQQYINTRQYAGVKLAHRFVTDQTFVLNKFDTFRIRYRLSSQFALNGQEVDPKELYLKINNEYLNAFQRTAYDFEVRVIPFLGFMFSDSNKLEFGLDYRVNSFVNDPASHRFWMGINWYYVL